MLTARSVLIAVIVVAVVSLALGTISLFRPPDSGGLAGDSYGTRGHGHRAVFELLPELGVPTERSLVPPDAVARRVDSATVVLWKPNGGLVETEPAYLRALAAWVRQGGRVVVAPDKSELDSARVMFGPKRHSKEPAPSLLEELGLPDVTLKSVTLAATSAPADDDRVRGEPQPETPDKAAGSDDSEKPDEDATPHGRKSSRELIKEILRGPKPVVEAKVTARATGELAKPLADVKSLLLPANETQALDAGGNEPEGRLEITDAAGNRHLLAGLWALDKGELIVVSGPALLENRWLAREDNSVAAARLLASDGRPVVFDEFYHGLTIRGNPFWLLTRDGAAAVFVVLMGVVGAWIWRHAVALGPPLPAPTVSRRSIGEYVEAMARFLNRGRSSVPFFLREARSGVLHAIGREIGLPAGRDDAERVAAALARRDPPRARRLLDAVAQVDRALEDPVSCHSDEAVTLLREMSRCL